MKKHKKYIQTTLLYLFFSTIVLFVGVTLHQTNSAKKYIANKIPACLEVSVREYIESKMAHNYYCVQHEYDPDNRKIGEYETRSIKYADTTFTYRSRIVDPGTDTYRTFQTALLDTDQLHADSIRIILDRLLQANNIYMKSAVGVTASFYTKKNEWSGDTILLDIDSRTVLANQGDYEDINYHVYADYSPFTIWMLMPKLLIVTLFACCVASGAALFWWSQKRKKEISDGIVLLKDGNYRIKNITYNTNESRIILGDKEMTLATNPHNLFLMFLEADNHEVYKKDIKQRFWSTYANPTTNMTSMINKLNEDLKGIGCSYIVKTNPENKKTYILSAK